MRTRAHRHRKGWSVLINCLIQINTTLTRQRGVKPKLATRVHGPLQPSRNTHQTKFAHRIQPTAAASTATPATHTNSQRNDDDTIKPTGRDGKKRLHASGTAGSMCCAYVIIGACGAANAMAGAANLGGWHSSAVRDEKRALFCLCESCAVYYTIIRVNLTPGTLCQTICNILYYT